MEPGANCDTTSKSLPKDLGRLSRKGLKMQRDDLKMPTDGQQAPDDLADFDQWDHIKDPRVPRLLGLYVLKNRQPVLTDSLDTFMRFVSTRAGIVAQEHIGPFFVSTVFLSHTLASALNPRPLFFESMIFGGTLDGACYRFETWTQAADGHRAIVAALRRMIAPARRCPRSRWPGLNRPALPGGPAPLPGGWGLKWGLRENFL
jgi:hypothetical protein